MYFNSFILLRPENLYVILARHDELPEDDILNVETCGSMLFVIIVFEIIVNNKECTVLVSKLWPFLVTVLNFKCVLVGWLCGFRLLIAL